MSATHPSRNANSVRLRGQSVQSTRQVEGAAQQLHDLGLKLKQIAETIRV